MSDSAGLARQGFSYPTELNPIYKGRDEVTRKVVRADPDEKNVGGVPNEMSWYEMFWCDKYRFLTSGSGSYHFVMSKPVSVLTWFWKLSVC